MKKELIAELFEKFEDACVDLDGLECWSARDLQKIDADCKNIKTKYKANAMSLKVPDTKLDKLNFSKMFQSKIFTLIARRA